MVFASWGWRSWLFLVLASVAVAGYLGILPAVERALEYKAPPTVIERLASQPRVAHLFSEPFHGRMDAYTVIFMFVFLSPLALVLVVTLGIFFLSAIASALAPVTGGEKTAMLLVEIVSGIAILATRESWLPAVMYFLGLIARAYVVITG